MCGKVPHVILVLVIHFFFTYDVYIPGYQSDTEHFRWLALPRSFMHVREGLNFTFPAQYDSSTIITFLVNYQKLALKTEFLEIFRKILEFV